MSRKVKRLRKQPRRLTPPLLLRNDAGERELIEVDQSFVTGERMRSGRVTALLVLGAGLRVEVLSRCISKRRVPVLAITNTLWQSDAPEAGAAFPAVRKQLRCNKCGRTLELVPGFSNARWRHCPCGHVATGAAFRESEARRLSWCSEHNAPICHECGICEADLQPHLQSCSRFAEVEDARRGALLAEVLELRAIRAGSGIYLTRVCRKCCKAKLSRYRPEILTGYSQADVDEPIEPEGGDF